MNTMKILQRPLIILLCVIFFGSFLTPVRAEGCYGCDDYPNSIQYTVNEPYIAVWRSGIIGSDIDSDWVKFVIDYPEVYYEIEVAGTTLAYPSFEVYDSNGNLLFKNMLTNKYSFYNTQAGRVLYLRVYSEEGKTGSYRFRSLPWFSIYPVAAYAENAGLHVYEPAGYKKTLVYFKGDSQGLGMGVFIDLADYTRVTDEGQNGWITIWGVFNVSGSVSAIPASFGVQEFTTGGLPTYGDDSLNGGSLGSIKIPGLSFSLIDSDNSAGTTYYLGTPISTQLLELTAIEAYYTLVKFEINRVMLDSILSGAFNTSFPVGSTPMTYYIADKILSVYKQNNAAYIRSATLSDINPPVPTPTPSYGD